MTPAPPHRWLGFALLAAAVATPWLAGAGMAAWLPGAADELCRKEGPLEHLTHGVLLAALLAHLARLAIPDHRLRHLLPSLLTLLFLLEEIDYGQVYLGFETPALLRPFTGRSDHLNFHNTTAADVLLPAFYGCYLIVLPLASHWERFRARVVRYRVAPLVPTVAWLFFVAALASYVLERAGYPGFDPTEMLDLTAASLLLAAGLAPRLLFRDSGLT